MWSHLLGCHFVFTGMVNGNTGSITFTGITGARRRTISITGVSTDGQQATLERMVRSGKTIPTDFVLKDCCGVGKC